MSENEIWRNFPRGRSREGNGEHPCVRPSVRGFRSLYWKVITQFILKLGVYTCKMSVQSWFAFGSRWTNFGPLVAKKNSKWLFPVVSDHYLEKNILSIPFKLGVYTCWVSVQNWYVFGPCCLNLGPLVAIKWLKMVVSYQYWKTNHQSISNFMYTLAG